MRYVLADKEKATVAGFKAVTHRTNDAIMLLNENEINHNPRLTGTLAERAEQLGGKPLKRVEVQLKIKRKGKYKLY